MELSFKVYDEPRKLTMEIPNKNLKFLVAKNDQFLGEKILYDFEIFTCACNFEWNYDLKRNLSTTYHIISLQI